MPMHKSVSRAALLSTASALIIGAMAGPANADHDFDGVVPTYNYDYVCTGSGQQWTWNGRVCMTDNKNVYWYADKYNPGELETEPPGDDVASIQTVINEHYGSPTELVIQYDSTPVFEGSGQTDWIFQEEEPGTELYLPAGYGGITWCATATSPLADGYRCDQHWVRLISPDGFRVYAGSLACHETGHAVGLTHGNEAAYLAAPYGRVAETSISRLGCMTAAEDLYPTYTTAATHHMINNNY